MTAKIHSTADVQSSKIGDGTMVWQNSIVLEGATIGRDCNINCFCFIENDVVLGNNVTLKSGVYVWDGITLEDNVFIGPNVTFVNDPYPRSKRYPDKFTRTIIRKGASIGAGSTINSGVEIGEYAMVGAGALVTKNVQPFTLWYGSPAKHMGYVTKEGEILTLDLKGKRSESLFELKNGEPIPVHKSL